MAASVINKAAIWSKNLQGSLHGARPCRVRTLGLIPGNARDARDAICVRCQGTVRIRDASFDSFFKRMQRAENAPAEHRYVVGSELCGWRLVA